MRKPKLYFSDIDDEFCHPIDYLIDEMKEQVLNELEVSEAVTLIKGDDFYCKANKAVNFKGCGYENPCGKVCDKYEPRNGKSGCCKHRGYCYTPGSEYKLTIDGKLTPISDLEHQAERV